MVRLSGDNYNINERTIWAPQEGIPCPKTTRSQFRNLEYTIDTESCFAQSLHLLIHHNTLLTWFPWTVGHGHSGNGGQCSTPRFGRERTKRPNHYLNLICNANLNGERSNDGKQFGHIPHPPGRHSPDQMTGGQPGYPAIHFKLILHSRTLHHYKSVIALLLDTPGGGFGN